MSASFPLIDMFAFSGLRNATTMVLSLWLNARRFEISEDIDVLPEYVKKSRGDFLSTWDSAFWTCF